MIPQAQQQGSTAGAPHANQGEAIRVRGLVQGVGFRPTVWRIAHEGGLPGTVLNDGDGVLIRLWGSREQIDGFCRQLLINCPPLGRIDRIERTRIEGPPPHPEFRIVESAAGAVHTGVVADAATCAECAAEIEDPADRRYRYPFTNCTHCGPRLSIVRAIPYDRRNTTMDAFPMCPECEREYRDPADRRFHAQPNACPKCGPRADLVDAAGRPLALAAGEDAIAAASRLLGEGRILAVKGIGGFHLACDAADAAAVTALRQRKGREAKPFALMARDLGVVRRFCRVGPAEAQLLRSAAAPIVLLEGCSLDAASAAAAPAAEVAPGQSGFGVMLAYSPLHRLLLRDWERPLVMTSGNRSDEPQCTGDEEARTRLGGLADAWLVHDRPIANRVDDSVAAVVCGQTRWLRRARGAAPAPLALPEGFAASPAVLALGGELKNTICLLSDGQAMLSQHLGDLEEAHTAREFERTVALYRALFEHRPEVIAVDRHPDYRSSALGQRLADELGVPLVAVQHHAGHLASVLADAQWPVDAGPVVALVLDGLGYGSDGTLWGGELLLGDYRSCARIGHLRRSTLPGGTRAILEPWRTLYAQLQATLGWETCLRRWPQAAPIQALRRRPIDLLGRLIARRLNAPETTSAGRLFDAVAAALGLCDGAIAYEAQAAIELETLAREAGDEPGYPFALETAAAPWELDPTPMWSALLEDLDRGAPAAAVAARFHAGFASALEAMAARAAEVHGLGTVALSGGVFQNRTLFAAVHRRLGERGLRVLSHRRVPTNDGGLSLGQAVAAALAGTG